MTRLRQKFAQRREKRNAHQRNGNVQRHCIAKVVRQRHRHGSVIRQIVVERVA